MCMGTASLNPYSPKAFGVTPISFEGIVLLHRSGRRYFKVIDLYWIGPHAEGSDKAFPHSICRLMLGKLYNKSRLHVLDEPREHRIICRFPFLELGIVDLWGLLLSFYVIQFVPAADVDKHQFGPNREVLPIEFDAYRNCFN